VQLDHVADAQGSYAEIAALFFERSDPLANWYGRAFYVSKVLWIILAGVLGFWLSAALLRTTL
jgi:hypothetical protein